MVHRSVLVETIDEDLTDELDASVEAARFDARRAVEVSSGIDVRFGRWNY